MKVSIVIPAYNEQQNIAPLCVRLHEVLEGLNCEFIFVDDGSNDGTLEELRSLSTGYQALKFISLSRNFGHQHALKAGIDHASGDCIVSLDADFQHPVELIPEMIKKWEEGNKIVYTIRNDSGDTGFFKKVSARFFYYLINTLSEVKIREGAADFRLIDRVVADQLRTSKETHLFYRAYIPWLGFSSCEIPYQANPRLSGKTKYSLKKMIGFAFDGITSFSTKPLRIATVVGMMFAVLAFLYGLYALYIFLYSGEVISGWTSVVTSIVLIGGIQLMFLGILGEYIGKLFLQAKERPLYVVKEKNL